MTLSGHHPLRKPSPLYTPPYSKRLKARHARRASAALPSRVHETAADYVEHLEGQLAALQNQLRALTSPTSTKLQSSKLRSLTAESRVLRQEVAEWEARFNERVRDETATRLEVEAGLRARIRALEHEVELRDARLAELECEVTRLRRGPDSLEALQDENLALARRLDVLTDVLAQSPTKAADTRPASPPPGTDAEDRRGKRRRLTLMIPRLAPSAEAVQSPARGPTLVRGKGFSSSGGAPSGPSSWLPPTGSADANDEGKMGLNMMDTPSAMALADIGPLF
jgi:polyhydroxyalkanoate synthesis regulator phasin